MRELLSDWYDECFCVQLSSVFREWSEPNVKTSISYRFYLHGVHVSCDQSHHNRFQNHFSSSSSLNSKKQIFTKLSLSLSVSKHTHKSYLCAIVSFFDMRRFFSKSDTVERKTRDFNRCSDRVYICRTTKKRERKRIFFSKWYLIDNPRGGNQTTLFYTIVIYWKRVCIILYR